MMPDSVIQGPHQRLAEKDATQQFIARLFDQLWELYRQRVSYVRVYEQVIREAGATFVNDHIAFRTFACQQPSAGIHSLSRIFESLGYLPAGVYSFADKHLSAVHYQHANADFPKLFISELKTWELDPPARQIIRATTASHRAPLADDVIDQLHQVPSLTSAQQQQLLEEVTGWFHQLPWNLPDRIAVEQLGEASQYAAWVLVHGYQVNHFTSLINSHQVEALDDIEKTIAALSQAGVPMKQQIEGAAGSRLRQSATAAVTIDVAVTEDGAPSSMPWSYAYFELAQRGDVLDPVSGRQHRFEGFLGPQATNLFEMTRVQS